MVQLSSIALQQTDFPPSPLCRCHRCSQARSCCTHSPLSIQATYTPAKGLQLWQMFPPGGPVAAPARWENVQAQPLLIRNDGRTRPATTCHNLLTAPVNCNRLSSHDAHAAGALPCNAALNYTTTDMVFLAGTWNPTMWVGCGRRQEWLIYYDHRPHVFSLQPCRKFALEPVNATSATGLFRVRMQASIA